MCGRFSLSCPPDAIRAEFGIDPGPDFVTRYNIAPTTVVPVIGVDRAGERRLGMLRWGLVPWWSKDASGGARMINARADGLSAKPAFREAFESRRCLVLADGFYEWKREGGHRTPMRIRLPDARPFAFAGLWERWRPEPGADPLYTFTIVTTAASAALEHIHDRMPVILGPAERETWLDPARGVEELKALLRPYEQPLEMYEVAPIVNSAANDVPACIEPVAVAR